MSESELSRLQASARRAQRDPQLAETLAAHCRDLQAGRLDTRIHPDCQMLAHSLNAHGDADLAVSQYFAVALQQYQVVRQLIKLLYGRFDRLQFLDFACGYGRLLRFLTHALPHEHIHAAEIQADAVEWIRQRYEIEALTSAAAPDDFRPARRFDMIWAASLFSHLPDGLFARWLARLGELLDEDGVLCFSVHDEATLPPSMSVPDSGLLYIAGSENAGLDPAIYGTTYVSQDYVERAVREQLGNNVSLCRLPRLLAHEQDVYVLARGRREFTTLEDFRRGPRGWLDELHIDPSGRKVHLAGWAGSLDGVGFDGVTISLDEQTFNQPVGLPTPKVAEVLGHAGLAHSGFSCTLELPDRRAPWLSLSAVTEDGESALIYCGRVQRE